MIDAVGGTLIAVSYRTISHTDKVRDSRTSAQMLFRLLTLWIAALLLLLFKIWRILNRLPPVQKGVVAFFHPFADGGGGGERVLWYVNRTCIHALAPDHLSTWR